MTNPSYISGVTSGPFTYTSGQTVEVVSGGLAYHMTIDRDAYEFLGSGGSATQTTVNGGGEVDVQAGGAVASGSLLSGGVQSVTAGKAVNTIVYARGLEDVSSAGADYSTVISNSGSEHVYSGGIAYESMVEKGGTEGISEGGTASGATVAAGGRLIVAGDLLYHNNFTATYGPEKAIGVYKGGVETITITGAKGAQYDKITNTATADGYVRHYFLSGGKVEFTEVRHGNEVYDTSSGKTYSRSSQQYLTPGSANAVTVDSGGSAVFAGGAITSLTVNSGGEEIIGGNSTVHSAGGTYIFKFTGLTVSDTVVDKGVKELVNSGNTALSATIAAGGFQFIAKGATADASTIDGGTLELAAGGKLETAVTFAGTGGELEIGGTVTPTATISGFTTTDKIKFLNIKSATGAHATVTTAGIVTIIDGGTDYKLHIAGATVGETFHFSSNSILTAAPAAAVAERTASASVAALLMSGGKEG